jgi:hypothetical protein
MTFAVRSDGERWIECCAVLGSECSTVFSGVARWQIVG